MSKRSIFFITIATIIVVLIYFPSKYENVASGTPQVAVKEHNLLIKKIKGHWKVVDATDTTKTRISAKKKDKISWTAVGTDAHFQFLDLKHFGDYTKSIKSGQKLSLILGQKIKGDTLTYAVFCTPSNVFARGESPPKIIIE